jgi:hypothetical protein
VATPSVFAGDRLVEEDLPGVDHLPADVDLEVDVRRAVAVPAGVDRQEAHDAVGVAALVARR